MDLSSPLPASPSYADTARLYDLTAAAKSLRAAAKEGDSSAKVKKAAKDFEALLLSSLLEEMKSFSDSLGGETDPASGSLQGLTISAVSQAMAAAGGLGIGKLILRQFESAPGGTPETRKI